MTLEEFFKIKSKEMHVWYFTSYDVDEKPKRMDKRALFKYRNWRVTHISADTDNIEQGYTVFLITIQPAE